jgi:hypothetical protein
MSNDPFFNFLTCFGSPAKPTSPFCIANGDSFFKASSLVELMIRKLGQDCREEEITLDFFKTLLFIIDSSSEEEESETSV